MSSSLYIVNLSGLGTKVVPTEVTMFLFLYNIVRYLFTETFQLFFFAGREQ